MMLTILVESALRSVLLGSVVWIALNLLRVRNPHVHMMCWVMVLVASLSMPLLMHWTTVTVTVDALPVSAAEHFWPAGPSGSPSPRGVDARRPIVQRQVSPPPGMNGVSRPFIVRLTRFEMPRGSAIPMPTVASFQSGVTGRDVTFEKSGLEK